MAMLAVMVAIGLQQAAAPVVPRAVAAQCADQLIAKNHELPVESVVLARRITDECYHQPTQSESGAAAVPPDLWHTLKGDFQRIVLERVLTARAKAIKLAR